MRGQMSLKMVAMFAASPNMGESLLSPNVL